MKTFVKEGKRLAQECNLKITEILKCFDAIPMICKEKKTTNNEVEKAEISQDDIKIVKHIGGFIVRKVSRKALSPEAKAFLQHCAVKNTQSALYDIAEPLQNILIFLEKKFRNCTPETTRNIQLSKLKGCCCQPDVIKLIKELAGESTLSRDVMHCMEAITGMFLKIRGHRFAAKIINEKLTEKNALALRKSLKKSS